jgi:hypothetical protein
MGPDEVGLAIIRRANRAHWRRERAFRTFRPTAARRTTLEFPLFADLLAILAKVRKELPSVDRLGEIVVVIFFCLFLGTCLVAVERETRQGLDCRQARCRTGEPFHSVRTGCVCVERPSR